MWIGPSLGPIHAACLRSFLRLGHQVVLYCYYKPSDVPQGVELADARDLLPESSIIRYGGKGSFSLFSNLFRYEILRAGLGLYVDCDVYCLKPIENADYIFGWEKYANFVRQINSAVLKLPQDCPALQQLCEIKHGRWPPTWLPRNKLAIPRWRWLLRPPRGRALLEQLPWGTTGPIALSYLLHRHGLEQHAKPIDVFYPIPGIHVSTLLVDPNLSLEELITHRTIAVHIFNEHFRNLGTDIPSSSPLGRIIAS
jgi:hypothetical protein